MGWDESPHQVDVVFLTLERDGQISEIELNSTVLMIVFDVRSNFEILIWDGQFHFFHGEISAKNAHFFMAAWHWQSSSSKLRTAWSEFSSGIFSKD